MKIITVAFLGLALALAASARTVPSCPAGSQQGTWKWEGHNRYNCKLLPTKKDYNGLDQCFEWEGTYWSKSITIPCGSRVSSVSDSDKPDPDNADPQNLPTPRPVRATSAAAEGHLLQRVLPAYPPLAKQARIQGDIVLDVVIGTDGSVNSAAVVSGHPMLVQSAIDAVKQWKYNPYMIDGKPVTVSTQVLVNFSLSRVGEDSPLRLQDARNEASPQPAPDSFALVRATGTIVVDSQQEGPRHTWAVQAHDAASPSISMTLLCSTDVAFDGGHDCGRLTNENGLPGGKFRATRLPVDDPFAYKHYITWNLKLVWEQSNGGYGDAGWVYAIYKIRDAQGHAYEGRYPGGTISPFIADGRNIDMNQADNQDKTDEQAVCLQYIQREPNLHDYNRLANHMPIPKVDCYDHITYTHVNLTNPSPGSTSVRGIIMHDNRPNSCGSGGCAMFLFVQGCPDYPGNEDSCRNDWTEGIATLGSDMKVTTVNHKGWYDIIVSGRIYPATASGVQESIYQYVQKSTYQSVTAIAREWKRAADETESRRRAALALGLHRGQSQSIVKSTLASRGFKSYLDEGIHTPWSCASSGLQSQDYRFRPIPSWYANCASIGKGYTLRLSFELGHVFRNPDTGQSYRVPEDTLVFAQFQFDSEHQNIELMSAEDCAYLKSTRTGDDESGICIPFSTLNFANRSI